MAGAKRSFSGTTSCFLASHLTLTPLHQFNIQLKANKFSGKKAGG